MLLYRIGVRTFGRNPNPRGQPYPRISMMHRGFFMTASAC